jgi:hypothetical protein
MIRIRSGIWYRSHFEAETNNMLDDILLLLFYWQTQVFFCFRSACFAAVEDEENIAARRADLKNSDKGY